MTPLSPALYRAILEREVFSFANTPPATGKDGKPQRLRAEEVTAYECPLCGDLHRDEDDAIECCQVEQIVGEAIDRSAYLRACPVCGERCWDVFSAADCCLWHDLDQSTRQTMARNVEAGSTWARELGIWPPEFALPQPDTNTT